MTKLGILAVIVGLGLSGCGGDKPEDVAEAFVSSLSKADMKSAKDVSTEETGKEIDRLVDFCNKALANKIILEADMILKTIQDPPSDLKKLKELENIMKGFSGLERLEFRKSIEKKFKEKYGDIRSIPEKDREKVMLETMGEMIEYAKPFISKQINILGIKTNYPEESAKVAAAVLMKGDLDVKCDFLEVTYMLISSMNKGKTDAVTPECVTDYTFYDNVDSIDILEVNQNSPDEAHVRLELIDKDGKSSKHDVYLEKIKGEWRVTRLQLINYRKLDLCR